MTSIALTIAGSDPSGGAGLQADLKTFAAHGVYGSSVVTALTAQNTRGVFGIHAVQQAFLRSQAEAVLEDLDVAAIKIGMLGDEATIETVRSVLASYPAIPVVLDPVMVAAGGDPLLEPAAAAALREQLVPLATLITPNLYEAALLLDQDPAETEEAMARQAEELLARGASAVLVKGGRRADRGAATDVLATRAGVVHLTTPRVDIHRPHGTGCTLSSAIAARIARGEALEESVRGAKEYVTACLERAAITRIGHGSRPLIHHGATGHAP